MRVVALTKRILQQIVRDKRTIGLLIFAPILVLTMLYLVFEGEDYIPKIGMINIPEPILEKIDETGAKITKYEDESEAKEDISSQDIDGYIVFKDQSPSIVLEGSDPIVNGAFIKWIQNELTSVSQNDDDHTEIEIDYVHGSSEIGQFDYFGPVLLGFFVFFFVFLIAGVSFLRERTTGTLERLFASPLRKWEIILGYVIGFGIFVMIQATIIVTYAIYGLDMLMEGSFWYVLLITLVLSLTALTLGILLSSFANNELQMMQFIPIIVIPQIFFSGLFNLETISKWLSWIGPFTPLYYAADALRNVMVRGYGWNAIALDISVMLGFSVIFIILNLLALRKYRKI